MFSRPTLAPLLLGLLLLAVATPALAQSAGPGLLHFLERLEPGDVIPGADRFGEPEGELPVVPAFDGERLAGWVFLNSDFVGTIGYSGRPIHIALGIDPEGTIVGARLVMHTEPIVVIGIPESRVLDYMEGFVGFNPLRALAEGRGPPDVDIVSGATVTVLVMGETMMRSAARVARRLGLAGAEPEDARPVRFLDPEAGEITDFETLLGEGSVRRLILTVGDVNEAFERAGHERAIARPEPGDPEETFIELYVALVSHPAIGESLLGEAEYANVTRMMEPERDAIVIAGDGRYSFKGSGYVRGGIFDRIELVQGLETVRFRDRDHRRIADLAADGAPRLREIGAFVVPEGSDFDPAQPWRLQLLVQRAVGPLDRAFVSFELDYRLPDHYLTPLPEPEPRPAVQDEPESVAELLAILDDDAPPLWVRIWESRIAAIAVLAAMIGVLTGIFFFQDFLTRYPVLFDRIRLAYLAVVLVWLGWVAGAQLSVVNVLTFTSALRTDFEWSYFMMDPLIFILWFGVAAALLFWGRGPFCGWLCPFGALQELSNRAGRMVRIPQITVPWVLHERLWPVKYIIFLVLFGVSLGALGLSERLAEVEPFKTAIVLRFMREWWFVAFALALIVAGLFVERFYCRYLCALGAALAIPGRLRMFDWLRRYRECGNPCMRCHNECPVQAIHPEGHINPNECISCLHCQVLYRHDQKCPVVVQRRVKRERRAAMASPSMRPGAEPPARVPVPAERRPTATVYEAAHIQ